MKLPTQPAPVPSAQTDLPSFLPVMQRLRPVLVPTAVAQAVLGLHPEFILALTELGWIRWVFDVSASARTHRGRHRALRFYLGELLAIAGNPAWTQGGPRFPKLVLPSPMRRDRLDKIIGQIIGTSARTLSTRRVQETLLVDCPLMFRLLKARHVHGIRHGRYWRVKRASLVKFLKKRLVN
jgi:hypothetical protein